MPIIASKTTEPKEFSRLRLLRTTPPQKPSLYFARDRKGAGESTLFLADSAANSA
jgi:hypothetical protein